MDRELTKIEQSKSNRGMIKWIILALAIIVAAIYLTRYFIKPKIDRNDIVIATVERGAIKNTLTATGTVIPAYETTINSPIASEINKIELRPGTEVSTGTKILSLKQDFIKLQVESMQDELQLKKNGVTKSSIEHQKSTKDLEYQNGILALKIESLKAGVNDLIKLEAIGGSTKEDVQRAQLDLQVQELEKKKLENDLYYSKSIFKSDQDNLNLEVSIKENELKKLRSQLGMADVKATSNGIITWINSNIGQQVTEGEPLVKIADLTTFKVKGIISDRYASSIQVGQALEFDINNKKAKGFISSILPEVTNNTITFNCEFSEPTSMSLRPNMSVEVSIITNAKTDALIVKKGPAYNGSKRFDFFVVKDKEAIRETLEIGLSNREFIEFVSPNIKEGDKIIITQMDKYDHLDKIEIK